MTEHQPKRTSYKQKFNKQIEIQQSAPSFEALKEEQLQKDDRLRIYDLQIKKQKNQRRIKKSLTKPELQQENQQKNSQISRHILRSKSVSQGQSAIKYLNFTKANQQKATSQKNLNANNNIFNNIDKKNQFQQQNDGKSLAEKRYQMAMKQNKDKKVSFPEQWNEQNNSSQEKGLKYQEMDSSDSQGGNIFENFGKNIPQGSQSQSDSSDDGNIFQKSLSRNNIIQSTQIIAKSKLGDMVRSFIGSDCNYEKIIKSSYIYGNYLLKNHRKDNGQDLRITKLQQGIRKQHKIPKHFFFKPQRIQFRKSTDPHLLQSKQDTSDMLFYVNQQRSRFYYRNLKGDIWLQGGQIRCRYIQLNIKDQISYGAQYDSINKRFYLFSNSQQKLHIYSENSLERIAAVSVQRRVIDPNLHFLHFRGRSFLMIVGGYINLQKDIAQGNQFIQFFQVKSWQIQLRSRLIKLIMGRINPIVILLKKKKNQRLLIFGGNNVAMINKSNLNFSCQKQINQSTNVSGVSINASDILQLFDYNQQKINITNLIVRINKPKLLYSGIVIMLKGGIYLVLPGSNTLRQIKVINREINFIERRDDLHLKQKVRQKNQLNLKLQGQNNIIARYIDANGYVQRLSPQAEQKQSKCPCAIY